MGRKKRGRRLSGDDADTAHAGAAQGSSSSKEQAKLTPKEIRRLKAASRRGGGHHRAEEQQHRSNHFNTSLKRRGNNKVDGRKSKIAVPPSKVKLAGEGGEARFFDVFGDFGALYAYVSGASSREGGANMKIAGRVQSECDGVLSPLHVTALGEIEEQQEENGIAFRCAGLTPKTASKIASVEKVKARMEKFASEVARVRKYAKLVALGPTGLDYSPEGLLLKSGGKKSKHKESDVRSRLTLKRQEAQRVALKMHLHLAQSLHMPLLLRMSPGARSGALCAEAEKDAAAVLVEAHEKMDENHPTIILLGFNGRPCTLEKFLAAFPSMMVSFNGCITYRSASKPPSKDVRDLLSAVFDAPLDRCLLLSDSPRYRPCYIEENASFPNYNSSIDDEAYVAEMRKHLPQTKLSDDPPSLPRHVPLIASALAATKRISVATALAATRDNAVRALGLDICISSPVKSECSVAHSTPPPHPLSIQKLCVICRGEIGNGEEMTCANGHAFHPEHLNQWIFTQRRQHPDKTPTCPTCRCSIEIETADIKKRIEDLNMRLEKAALAGGEIADVHDLLAVPLNFPHMLE